MLGSREFVTALNIAVLQVGSFSHRLELSRVTHIMFFTSDPVIFSGSPQGLDRCAIALPVHWALFSDHNLKDLISCGVSPHAIAPVLTDAVHEVRRPPTVPRYMIGGPVGQRQAVFVPG